MQLLHWRRISDWSVLVTFAIINKKVAHFQVCHWLLNAQYKRVCLVRKTFTEMTEHSPLVHTWSIPLTYIFCTWESWKCYTVRDYICTVSSEFNILNLWTWVGSWNSAVGLMHIPACITTFCLMMRHTLAMLEWIIPEIFIYDLMTTHIEQ
jgi:hypothetical protein